MVPIQSLRTLIQSTSSPHHLVQVHAHLITTSLLRDPFFSGNLLHSHLKLNASSLSHALSLLLSFPNPSTFAFNTLLHSLLRHRHHHHLLLLLLLRFPRNPNSHSFPLLLKALSQLRSLPAGESLHSSILKLGFLSHSFVHSSLIHFYAAFRRLDSSRSLFYEIPVRSVASWTALLSGYAKFGNLENARKVFDEMPERNAVSWAAMISGYVDACLFTEALALFRDMLAVEKNLRPCASVFVSVLSAVAAEVGGLHEGRWVHAYLMRVEWVDWTPNLVTSLVHMYAKCGDLASARQVFERNAGGMAVDVWNAMINGLGLHGRGREALELFERMVGEGMEPDDLTFVGVLSGCSHGGLVKEGLACFEGMRRVHGVVPKVEHYSCVVDLLARAGLLDEAMEVIRIMPMEPNKRIWGSLFGACRIYGDVELGERVGGHLIELEMDRAGHYVLLANLYASKGRYEDAVGVRETMKRRGVELEPGCSVIEINGVVHEFLVGDRAHPRAREIYDMLEEIEKKLRLRGYVPDTNNVLFDISEEEKEGVLFWHSEKLAIALGLIAMRPGDVIRIVKNLRICRDCHSMAKAVAGAYGREIVIRDRSRFHHFQQGSCSCSDYW